MQYVEIYIHTPVGSLDIGLHLDIHLAGIHK